MEVAVIPSLYRCVRLAAGVLMTSALAMSLAGCADVVTYAKDSQDRGVKLYNDGNYADAAGAFRNATRQDPRDYKSHFYLGQSYEQLHQYQQAIQAYRSTLDVMNVSLEGTEDKPFRSKVIETYARCISKSDQRETERGLLEKRAADRQTAEDNLILA
jgi:tetratricopeptide (TPR) repeat protein